MNKKDEKLKAKGEVSGRKGMKRSLAKVALYSLAMTFQPSQHLAETTFMGLCVTTCFNNNAPDQ